MKARFGDSPLNENLIITAESHEEATKLERWHDCFVSTRFNYDYSKTEHRSELTFMKET